MAYPTRFAPGFLVPTVDALELRSPSGLVESGTLTVYDDPSRGPDVQVLLHSSTQYQVSPPLSLPNSLRGSPTISPGGTRVHDAVKESQKVVRELTGHAAQASVHENRRAETKKKDGT